MIRAALIFASGKINRSISDKSLLTLATAIELIHTYSLIHDDLPCMDDDDFRRGKDSNHIKYGEANAILAGDALQTLAYEIICDDSDLKPNEKVEAIKLISMACGKRGMVYGQYLDVSSESKNLDEKIIESIHKLKTGELIKSSVMLGQIGNDDKTKKETLEKQINEEIKKAEQEIEVLKKGAPEKINKIAIETSSELLKNLIGAEVNNSSISAIVDDLSKKNGDKYYGH